MFWEKRVKGRSHKDEEQDGKEVKKKTEVKETFLWLKLGNFKEDLYV